MGAIAEKMPIAMIMLRVSIFDASSCMPVENAIIDLRVIERLLTAESSYLMDHDGQNCAKHFLGTLL